MRPDIDDFIVTLTRSNQACRPLLLNILNLFFSGIDQVGFFFRNDHIVDTDRNSRTGRVMVTGIHELVSQNDRILEADITVTGIDQGRHILFIERFINQIERHPLGKQFT